MNQSGNNSQGNTSSGSKSQGSYTQNNNSDFIDPTQELSSLGSNDNLRILYITLGVIIGILLLWIVIVMFTREDPLKILSEMTSLAAQLKPVTDLQQTQLDNQDIPINTFNNFNTFTNDVI